MKVLFATSEFADFAKAGGLGEVSAGLPRALQHRGIDARVLLPAYPEVISRAIDITVVAHLPGRAGNGFHMHSGDQWEAVIEGEITFTVRGQQPRVLKTGEFVYIPRGTIHRNENKSNAPTRTIELLIMDKDKPQNTPAPAE